MLAGLLLVPVEGLAPSRRPYQRRHTLSCVDRQNGIPSWTRTNAKSLRRAHAAVLRPGYVGSPPGFRAQPFPLIWQVSGAYKAPPLTRAADHENGLLGKNRTYTSNVRSIGAVVHRPGDGSGGETCTHLYRLMRPARNYLRLPRYKMVPREVLAPSSLPLQGSA